MGGRILLVEDRLQSRKNIAYFLRTEGYEVNEASSGKEAIEILERDEFDLVLPDVVMPNLKGSGVFSQCRDKTSLDIFWLRDESLEESDNLPDPEVFAQEIVEDLKAALEQFREIARISMPPSEKGQKTS